MPRTRRNSRRRWPLWTCTAVSLSVLATSCTGWSMMDRFDSTVGRVDPFSGLRSRPAEDTAQDFLVVGTDEREGVPRATLARLHAGGTSCDCTDTMLLVHLSKDRSRASVVSIPRDSYVTIPAHRDRRTGKEVAARKGKINAAYGMGGPKLTVQTVEQATGVRLDHYLQVDFLTFISTVDALGGVDVCTTRPLHDPKSGLDLSPGTHRLDGAEALKYVRARYVDGSADIGRMQRQQKFVAQMLKQMRSSGTLLSPGRLSAVAGTVMKSVKADKGLSAQDVVDLASGLKDLSPSRASFTTVPTSDLNHVVPGWGSTVLWDKERAQRLFTRIRKDEPPAAAAHTPSRGASSDASAPEPGSGVRSGDQVACP